MLTSLPIDALLPRAAEMLRAHGSLVVIAPPGSGKTTRLAPALLDQVPGKILLLQPRRVAARLSARRIAEERGGKIGGEVGYRVRFDTQVGPATRLEVVTEGLLTRALLRDPFLEGVDAVVLDEFHERSLDADLCLAMLRELQADARPELRIVVMSATLNPAPIAAFLGDAPVLNAPGRTYPVDLRYRPGHGYLEQQVSGAVRSVLPGLEGHVLVFLPGKGEIRRCQEALQDLSVPVLPLHGGLKAQEQERALAASQSPKVVLSTNIAETSVTLPGVRVVIDSGLSRVPRFDPALGLSRLELVPISQASADQRAGRAGRTGPGVAIRLWDRNTGLEAQQPPEIVRSDLCGALLSVLEWGRKPADFGWFQAPPGPLLARSLHTLGTLGATRGQPAELALSPTGRALAQLPVHPRLGRVVLEGHAQGCLWAAAVAAAFASERDPYAQARFPGAREDDLHARVQALAKGQPGHRRQMRELQAVVQQLMLLAQQVLGKTSTAKEVPDGRTLAQCLLSGFADRVAMRRAPGSERFKLASGQGARLDGESLVEDVDLVLAVSLEGGRRGQFSEHWIRIAAPVHPEDLPTEARRVLALDAGRVQCETQVVVGTLVLRRSPARATDAELAQLFAEHVHADPAAVLRFSPELESLQARVALLRQACPELDLPVMDPLASVAELVVGVRSWEGVKKMDWARALKDRLTWPQKQALEQHAPERLKLASGSTAKILYTQDTPPVLPARIQQVFGMQTPRIAKGRVGLRVHLLAPNGRPQQVTDDLGGFWTGSYAAVRKELRGRYPKWAWPETPTLADAQDRPRRKKR